MDHLQRHFGPLKEQVTLKHLYALSGLAFICITPLNSSVEVTMNKFLMEESKVYSLNLPDPKT
jgi:hypothetical protein